MHERLRRLQRLLPVYAVRLLPLPPLLKFWGIWSLSARYRLGVHAVIRDPAGAVLVLQPSYQSGLQLPGGTVGYGESFDQAMAREGLEELGVQLTELQLMALLFDSSGRQLHAVYTACLGPGGVRLSEEHTEWRFEPRTRLPGFLARLVDYTLSAPAPLPPIAAVDLWG